MMLNFYGIELINEETGELRRNESNYRSRYKNLRESHHNFLRINRILTSLGHLGFRRYKQSLVDFLDQEVNNKSLPECRPSLERFWKKTLEENTKQYLKKTKETEQDRTESIFFYHLENKTDEYQIYLERMTQEDMLRSDYREAAEEKERKMIEKEQKKRMKTKKYQDSNRYSEKQEVIETDISDEDTDKTEEVDSCDNEEDIKQKFDYIEQFLSRTKSGDLSQLKESQRTKRSKMRRVKTEEKLVGFSVGSQNDY
eukprot:TRINITY_DN1149_c1_g1_i3.p1 TRINITY_DN1149_c1_g1~~TRINITY_DN1149_c1_g1_i3.p1  ORF type:complete len:256 (+),score=63.58 TRINITY_DN1149_c1_g1_i3:420-1187(+)